MECFQSDVSVYHTTQDGWVKPSLISHMQSMLHYFHMHTILCYLASLCCMADSHSRLGASFTLKGDHQLAQIVDFWTVLDSHRHRHVLHIMYHTSSVTWPNFSANQWWLFYFFTMYYLASFSVDRVVSRCFAQTLVANLSG